MAITETTDLEAHGISPRGQVYWNPTVSQCYTHALARGDGCLAEGGSLVVDTGRHTGRSPQDRYVVREPGSEDRIAWGDVNVPIAEETFESLRERLADRLGSGDLYVVDAFAGADPGHRLAVRVVTESPWHALFARTLFIDPSERELADHRPQALVLHAPSVEAEPSEDGTRSETFILLHPTRGEVLIGGTLYAGEIKKSIFAVMNDRLPLEGVLSMHCSANVGEEGRVGDLLRPVRHGEDDALGRPRAAPHRRRRARLGRLGHLQPRGRLLRQGDPLSPEAEPEIYRTTRTWGTVLENVIVDERGILDLDDDSKTENTRAAYKLEQIENALPEKRAGHPSAVVFLTADAFGILPPIARLTRDQALFYFLSGFTAKLAGTEVGVEEPTPTFSACFGAPFLPQAPAVYAGMLGEKLDEHRRSRSGS